MRRTSKIGAVERKLDKIYWDFVRQRDGNRCVLCGSTSSLGPHHIFAKGRHKNLRWNVRNLVTLCWWRCHQGLHNGYGKVLAEFDRKFPGKHLELEELDKMIPRLKDHEIRELYEKLKDDPKQLYAELAERNEA